MIERALAEQGMAIPDDVTTPEVWPSAAPYRRAFHVLSAARARTAAMFGVIPQPIEYAAIVAYAERNGFASTESDLEDFVLLIQSQDARHLALVAKAQERKK